MKTIQIKYYALALAAVSGLLLLAFSQSGPVTETTITDKTTLEIPELLVRNDLMKNTIEWEGRVNRVNAFSADLIKDPGNAKALLGLASEFSKEARVSGEHGYYYPKVLYLTDKALEINDLNDDTRFQAMHLKAQTLLSQHQFSEALDVATQARQLQPENVDILTALTDANVELGNYKRAAICAQNLLDLKPGLISYARASYIREINGDVDGAIEAMQKAVDAGYPGYENTEWCRLTLAELYERYGEPEKALALYEESLLHRPGYPFALAGIASFERQNENYQKAEELLLLALEAVPEISFQEELYLTYRDWGKNSEASNAYSVMLEMLQDDITHGHNMDIEMAVILMDFAGQPAEALTYAQRQYDARPSNIDINLLMAEIHFNMDDRQKAKQYLEAATRTQAAYPGIEELKSALSM